MTLRDERGLFEQNKVIYESAVLTFHGVEGYDVYNGSIPFEWEGKRYIYGRVERREEFARSWSRLFYETGEDDWTLVPNSMIYQIEDPFVTFADGKLILGGNYCPTYIGEGWHYFVNFYRGTDLEDMYQFACGPDPMKDVRLIELADGKTGVFSRPNTPDIEAKYGSKSIVGFTVIDSLDCLTRQVIMDAKPIIGLFGDAEWGGPNQVYLLDSGLIGVAGHQSYVIWGKDGGRDLFTYLAITFVFDPVKHEILDKKIIATRTCFPDGPCMNDQTDDTIFTSGLVPRDDGKMDLYCGLNDCQFGRAVINDPFVGFGKIVKGYKR